MVPPGADIFGADKPAETAVGLLGADFEPGENGSWRVERIIPGESSEPRSRSPLTTPGAQIGAGDELLAVDGQPLHLATGPGGPLVGAAGKPVELTIRPAAGGELRRTVVVALADERRLRYQDWVAGRRRLVREASDGRIGYLHVPDMVAEGWADFHRDLRTEMARDALIIDVRCNHGGHTSELVVEKLARRVIGWDVPRDGEASTYPGDAPRGPVVALADEFAGSDGDIVTAAIRSLGLGPVVGTRTWGGVIGIDVPLHELVDGTSMSIPKYAFWFDRFGWVSRTTAWTPTWRWSSRPKTGRPAATLSSPRRSGSRWSGWPPSPQRPGPTGPSGRPSGVPRCRRVRADRDCGPQPAVR